MYYIKALNNLPKKSGCKTINPNSKNNLDMLVNRKPLGLLTFFITQIHINTKRLCNDTNSQFEDNPASLSSLNN